MKHNNLSVSRRLISLWSPEPFSGYYRYTIFLQKLFDTIPHCLVLHCRYGYDTAVLHFLAQSDLICVLLRSDMYSLDSALSDPAFRSGKSLFLLCDHDLMPDWLTRHLAIDPAHIIRMPDPAVFPSGGSAGDPDCTADTDVYQLRQKLLRFLEK